jgi:predicted RecB family nuclease
MRKEGIATRVDLAQLRPDLAKRNINAGLNEHTTTEEILGDAIDRFDDLIYRARAHVAGQPLLIVSPEELTCPAAEVEVDVDMESYNDVTYLWGALVSTRVDVEGIAPGYHAFSSWEPLTADVEAQVFTAFWTWFQSLRDACLQNGVTFRAYCFWAQAEDGAMNRAVATGSNGSPTLQMIEQFRSSDPRQWIDMHDVVKRQIQTEGPLGLKTLAMSAGFTWRDANPSGEASMTWYEEAVQASNHDDAERSRTRLLEYNEDDCRATQALRQWINGPARTLMHRDDPQFTQLDPR